MWFCKSILRSLPPCWFLVCKSPPTLSSVWVRMLYVDRRIEWIEQSRSLVLDIAANSRKILVVC